MKTKVLFTFLLLAGISSFSFAQKKKDKDKTKDTPAQTQTIKLATKMDTISYCIGVSIGKSLSAIGVDGIQTNVLKTAIDEMLTKKVPLFDEAKANEIIRSFMMAQMQNKSDKNLKEGQAFLEKNKKEPGVIITKSGLQYKIIKEGNGPKPDSSSKVTVHYHGTLIDGKVFDSSVDRGQPLQLSVTGVIPGWTEALLMMPVGSKWKLFIPANLAYGERAPGGQIEANMALIFDVELISIDKDSAPQNEAPVEIAPATEQAPAPKK